MHIAFDALVLVGLLIPDDVWHIRAVALWETIKAAGHSAVYFDCSCRRVHQRNHTPPPRKSPHNRHCGCARPLAGPGAQYGYRLDSAWCAWLVSRRAQSHPEFSKSVHTPLAHSG